jgi:hypothetical protein
MAGLDPVIHVFGTPHIALVDARDKSGYDDLLLARSPP